MKSAIKTFEKTYPMLRLYFDDLKEIIKIFIKSYTKVEVEIDGYRIQKEDQIEEIRNIRKAPITACKIIGRGEYKTGGIIEKGEIRLIFTKNSAEIFSPDGETTFSLGVVAEIENIILKRKSKVNFIANNLFFFSYIYLFFLLAILLVFLLRLDSLVSYYLYIIFVAIMFLSGVFSIYLKHKRFYKYITVERFDYVNKSNFFLRKKDEILFALLSAFFGSLVTFISTWLTGHLH